MSSVFVPERFNHNRGQLVFRPASPNKEFKPMLFDNGVRMPFPAPTKSIRAPRLRRKDPRAQVPHGRDHRRFH